jgi:hypothetical protein
MGVQLLSTGTQLILIHYNILNVCLNGLLSSGASQLVALPVANLCFRTCSVSRH